MAEQLAFNMDCLEAMREMPDKAFDLAVVDPPYGGGAKEDASEVFNGAISGRFGGRFEKYIKAERTGGSWSRKYQTDNTNIKNWDVAPSEEYFEQLFRVSKNCIIWGGKLFPVTADKMLSYLAQADNIRIVFNGYGRIRLDKLQ